MPDDFQTCKTKDDAAYDYFACQFFQSLRDYGSGYWFGRLVAYGYTLQDMFAPGNNFDEAGLHSSIENGSLIIHDYTLISVDYAPDPKDPDVIIATGKVEIDYTQNGQRDTTQRNFEFRLKRAWHATQMIFNTPV